MNCLKTYLLTELRTMKNNYLCIADHIVFIAENSTELEECLTIHKHLH